MIWHSVCKTIKRSVALSVALTLIDIFTGF